MLGIHSCPLTQHFYSGSISFFHLYMTFLLIPTIPLLPFFIIHHLTNNRYHHFLNILPLSFTCFLILIILLLTIFSNHVSYLFFVQYIIIISVSSNFLTSHFLCLAPCLFLYFDNICLIFNSN